MTDLSIFDLHHVVRSFLDTDTVMTEMVLIIFRVKQALLTATSRLLETSCRELSQILLSWQSQKMLQNRTQRKRTILHRWVAPWSDALETWPRHRVCSFWHWIFSFSLFYSHRPRLKLARSRPSLFREFILSGRRRSDCPSFCGILHQRARVRRGDRHTRSQSQKPLYSQPLRPCNQVSR